ncbi:MAG: DUF433 domain-containing protein [Candidatus Adiutricales bacterium]
MEKKRAMDIYGGKDPRNETVYTIPEAARYLRIPAATLRSWVLGRQYPRQDSQAYFEPLIRLPDPQYNQLSFNNLVESHLLRALRQIHQIKIADIRVAFEYAEKQFGVDRLLLSKDLLLNSQTRDLFIERYGELINLSLGGQLAMKDILFEYLKRVEWDANMPVRLFPVYGVRAGHKVIVIDPLISFGRPVLNSKKISTSVIAERIDSGESPESIADDYDLHPQEVMEALFYEKAA